MVQPTDKLPPLQASQYKDEYALEEEEKMNWISWLGPKFGGRLSHIRDSVTQIFGDHRNIPPLRGFTPHAVSHCQAVENLIHHLIPETLFRGLREYERFLLLASAWLHDIGMQRGLMGKKDEEQSDENIRATHHERAERFIVNHPARCGVDESDAQALGVLVRLHGTSLDSVEERLAVGGESVRIRLLAAYLCLADALHIDASRSPADLYAICLAYNVPISTKIHWIKSRFVSGIDIDVVKKRIVLQFKEPIQSQFNNDLHEQGVDRNKISRIHDVVVNEVSRNLEMVKTELFLGGISYFLKVEKQVIPMHLDDQVLRDLKQIANNRDFMANPSSSRLSQLMLRTVADILNLNDNGDAIEKTVSISEQIVRCNNVLDALRDINRGVLEERPCHLALKDLVERIRQKAEDVIQELGRKNTEESERGESCLSCPASAAQCSNSSSSTSSDNNTSKQYSNKLVEYIGEEIREREKMRRAIRHVAQSYFHYFLDQIKKTNTDSKEPLVSAYPITIMLFGYSELVIKALCGFRDRVLMSVLKRYLEELENGSDLSTHFPHNVRLQPKDMQQPLHQVNLEQIASDHFRLFVMAGEPKTQTNSSTGQLSFHDGRQYAEALGDHGFSNIIIVTDIAGVGNLLHRCRCGHDTIITPNDSEKSHEPMVDLVMMGVNGIQKDRFLHGTGHLGVAAAVASLSTMYEKSRFSRLPRLVFVADRTKFQKKQKNKKNSEDPPPSPLQDRWSWLDTPCVSKDDFCIQKGFTGEQVRDKPFLVRDRTMQNQFRDKRIRLYNPREEAVWCSLVDDLIWDDGYFYGDDRCSANREDSFICQSEDRQGKAFCRAADGQYKPASCNHTSDSGKTTLKKIIRKKIVENRKCRDNPKSSAGGSGGDHQEEKTEKHDYSEHQAQGKRSGPQENLQKAHNERPDNGN
jgi:hypothetical protein